MQQAARLRQHVRHVHRPNGTRAAAARYDRAIGYDLHITRAGFWPDSAESPIGVDEWKAYVEAADDLEWEPEGTFLADAEADVAVWVRHPDPGFEAWLAYSEGEVFAKNPDEAFLSKMHVIATDLRATLQGDDGETYGADGRPLQEPVISTARSGDAAARAGLLSRLFGRRP